MCAQYHDTYSGLYTWLHDVKGQLLKQPYAVDGTENKGNSERTECTCTQRKSGFAEGSYQYM
jgi:hypothetical protein